MGIQGQGLRLAFQGLVFDKNFQGQAIEFRGHKILLTNKDKYKQAS